MPSQIRPNRQISAVVRMILYVQNIYYSFRRKVRSYLGLKDGINEKAKKWLEHAAKTGSIELPP